MKKAIVAGASGIIGGQIIQHLDALEEWEVIGISRHKPFMDAQATFVSMDLNDYENTKETVSNLDGITHIFFAAYQDYPAFSEEQITVNTEMLENLVKAVEETQPTFEHVTLMQGAKVYGVHLGGDFKTPAKESDPRHMPPNFYFNQEDFLRAHGKGKNWNWTILRPDVVAGIAVGNPMNIMSVIGVYAAISKELGLPLRFPGKQETYDSLAQMTDSGLLAKASVWAGTTPEAFGEAFNVTNGDVFRWKYLWQTIADAFDMEVGVPQELPLTEIMPVQKELWDSMMEKYGLVEIPYERAAGWGFGDFVFKTKHDVISDVNKIKEHGFLEFENTEKMMARLLNEMREQKILP